MKRLTAGVLAGALLALAGGAGAADERELLREVLRQQSGAQREACGAVARALDAEPDTALVVRTAVAIGYNPCEVVRCAIESGGDLARVVQGAGEAGVTADVVARCAVEAGADAAAVASALANLVFEPTFCYFTFGPAGPAGPAALPQPQPVVDRAYRGRPQASTFTF